MLAAISLSFSHGQLAVAEFAARTRPQWPKRIAQGLLRRNPCEMAATDRLAGPSGLVKRVAQTHLTDPVTKCGINPTFPF